MAKNLLSKCFPLTKKGRARALRLYLGAKRFGLRARMLASDKGKGRVCVVARATKSASMRRVRAQMHRVSRKGLASFGRCK